MNRGRQGAGNLFIFGAGKAIIELEEMNGGCGFDGYNNVILVEDMPTSDTQRGFEVISHSEAMELKEAVYNNYAFVSCNNVGYKERVHRDFPKAKYVSFIAKNSDYHLFETPKNLWVAAMCHVSGYASIGDFVRINYGAKIGHHTIIGDYSFVSINAVTLSGVQIGHKCLIGAGAVLLEDVKVGDNCVIGAGAVVTKDVPDNTKAMGVPARW